MDEPRLNELRELPQYSRAKSSSLTETLNVRERRHFETGLPQRLSRLSGTAVEPIRQFLFAATPSPREAQLRVIEFSHHSGHFFDYAPPRPGFLQILYDIVCTTILNT
jgi:hypothetical protein